MRWVLFYVLIVLYVVVTTLTILSLFFGLGDLEVSFKKPLFITFIIEIGITITALFYSLFGLKKSPTQVLPKKIDTEIIRDVDVVNDSPLKTEIQLNSPVELLESYNHEIQSMLASEEFSKEFYPSMLLFTSLATDYKETTPTIVIQLLADPLPQLNMTLADYLDSAHAQTADMQNIIGKRQVRVGTTIGTQWYRAKLTNLFGKDVDLDIVYTQFQKVVVSDGRMGIVTITYGDETTPKDIKILQDVLKEFGIAKQA